MKTFVTIIISIIFIPIFIALVLYYSLSSTIINAKTIPSILAKNNSYTIIIEQIWPNAIESYLQSMLPKDSSANLEEQKKIINSIKESTKQNINPAWLKSQLETFYTKLISYINGTSTDTKIGLDLTPLAQSLNNDTLKNLIYSAENLKAQFDSWPECTSNQSSNCRPPGMTYTDFEKMVKDQLSQTEKSGSIIIPEKIDVYQSLKNSGAQENPLDVAKRFYNLVQNFALFFTILELILLVIIILMFMKEKNRLFKALGIILIIPGLVFLLFSLPGFLLQSSIVRMLLGQIGISQFGPDAINLVSLVISGIASNFFAKILISAMIILVISILFLVLSSKYKTKFKEGK